MSVYYSVSHKNLVDICSIAIAIVIRQNISCIRRKCTSAHSITTLWKIIAMTSLHLFCTESCLGYKQNPFLIVEFSSRNNVNYKFYCTKYIYVRTLLMVVALLKCFSCKTISTVSYHAIHLLECPELLFEAEWAFLFQACFANLGKLSRKLKATKGLDCPSVWSSNAVSVPGSRKF